MCCFHTDRRTHIESKTLPIISNIFRVGATFEMRTVLYGIHLLIYSMIMHDKVYIHNQTEWGESKIAERQRKREGEKQSIAEISEKAWAINLIIYS